MPSNYDADAGRLPSQGPGLLAAVRRHPLIVLASVIVAAALGVLATFLLPTNYVADAQISVGDPNTVTVFDKVPQQSATALGENAAQIMRSQAVYDRASAILKTEGHSLLPSDVSGSVVVTPATGSPVVTIEATEGSAKFARDAADAEGKAYLEVRDTQTASKSTRTLAELALRQSSDQSDLNALRNQSEKRAAQIAKRSLSIVSPADRARYVQAALQSDPTYTALQSQGNNLQQNLSSLKQKVSQVRTDAALLAKGVDTLYGATLPDNPTSSNIKRNVALAAALGLLVGVALAWRRFDRRRVLDQRDIAATLEAPMLGHVRRSKELSDPTKVIDLTPGRQLSDDLRVLASSLMLHMRRSGLRRCVVSSARIGEGKTVIALNLAAAANSAGHDVVLIDGDIRNSALSQAYHRPEGDQFVDLFGGANFGEQVGELPPALDTRLPVIPIGPANNARAEQAGGRNTRLLDFSDHPGQSAIVDAPGVFEDPVTLWLASGPAGLVVVVSAASTIADLRTLRTRAELAGVRIFGFIVNDYRPKPRRRSASHDQRYRRPAKVEAPAAEESPLPPAAVVSN